LSDLQSKVSLTQALNESFLKAQPPSGNEGKFAADLYLAIQNHTPLTFLQKAFIFWVAGIPGPVGWRLALFSYLDSLPQTLSTGLSSLWVPIIGIVLVCIILYTIYKIYWRRFSRRESFLFLELVFPESTSKTAYATEQLFTLLHALAGQRSFIRRVLGFKKEYSLEIVATKEQGIRYILCLPNSDAFVIQKSLISYLPGLKINEIEEYLSQKLLGKSKQKKSNGTVTKVVELKLSNDFVLPLRENKALDEHDPIAYLTGNMTKLESEEMMVFQIVASPVTRSGHRNVIKHINRIGNLIYANKPLSAELNKNPALAILNALLSIMKAVFTAISACIEFLVSMVIAAWDTTGKDVPFFQHKPKAEKTIETLNPYESELRGVIKNKTDQSLFETSLRLLVVSEDAAKCQQRISGFLATLSQLSSSYQSLILKPAGILSYLSSLFRLSSIFLLGRREVSLSGNPILSSSELADLYHFPYSRSSKTEDMVKIKSQPLSAPLSFKQSATELDNVFAKNDYGGSETVIGQTLEERRRHTYILGATGSGKTTLLSTMIYEDILNGKGVAVLDPHGQLIEKLLPVIPKNRIKDIVWFAPDDDGFPIALNLLELKSDNLSTSQLQKQKSLIASSIISIFQKFYDAKYFGPRMEYVLRNTILTALETEDPTLQTIINLLTKTKYRKEVVKSLTNMVLRDFWVYEFEKIGSMQRNQVISPITNKIGGVLSSPINYNILSQVKNKLDFDDIMNSGKILLCDLSKGKIGEDESSFFGSLIIAKIQLSALKRVTIPEDDRKDFFLYVDEFQNFATNTFTELVSEARKYRLATIMAHQSISQITDRDIIKVILANVGTVICFKTANPEDEQFILPIFSPEVQKHEIANLPLYHFYMKLAVRQAQDTFLAKADNFTALGSQKTTDAAVAESRKRYATPVEELVQPETKETEVPKKAVKKPTKKVAPRQKDKEKSTGHEEGILPPLRG